MAEAETLSHSGLCVHDLKEAENFYCGILGAQLVNAVNFYTEDTLNGRAMLAHGMMNQLRVRHILRGVIGTDRKTRPHRRRKAAGPVRLTSVSDVESRSRRPAKAKRQQSRFQGETQLFPAAIH